MKTAKLMFLLLMSLFLGTSCRIAPFNAPKMDYVKFLKNNTNERDLSDFDLRDKYMDLFGGGEFGRLFPDTKFVSERYDLGPIPKFYFGRIRAKENVSGKYGFLDERGRVAVPFIYDDVSIFQERRAAVMRDGKWGFVDKKGNEVVPVIYSAVNDFSDGFACVKSSAGKWGYVDMSGNEIIPLIYENALDFSEGLAAVQYNGKWGFINEDGEVEIPFKYSDVFSFWHGRAAVRNENLMGYVDRAGKEVVPLEYEQVTPTFGSRKSGNDIPWLTRVRKNGRWGIVGRTGELLQSLKYDEIRDFHEGLAAVRCGNLWGYIDINADEFIAPKYKKVGDFDRDGFAEVYLCGFPFRIDRNGNLYNYFPQILIALSLLIATGGNI